MSENRPSNENAPRVPGEEGDGAPWGKILAAVAALILLAILIPFACQAFGSGSDEGAGSQGSSGSEETSGEGNGGEGGSAGTDDNETTGASGVEETTGVEAAETNGSQEGRATAELSGIGYQDNSDGESVTVPQAALSGSGGWLAIRADDGGEPGEVLGYAPLEEGENTDVEVEFDRPVESSQKLYAVVHAEDPADGDYTFPDGDPPIMQNGEMAAEPIQYAVAGESEAADGDASDGDASDGDASDESATSGSGSAEPLADTSGPTLPAFVGGALLLAAGGLLSLYLRGRGT